MDVHANSGAKMEEGFLRIKKGGNDVPSICLLCDFMTQALETPLQYTYLAMTMMQGSHVNRCHQLIPRTSIPPFHALKNCIMVMMAPPCEIETMCILLLPYLTLKGAPSFKILELRTRLNGNVIHS